METHQNADELLHPGLGRGLARVQLRGVERNQIDVAGHAANQLPQLVRSGFGVGFVFNKSPLEAYSSVGLFNIVPVTVHISY